MVEKFNVFVLPHAGGNKYAYKPFVDAAPPLVNVIPLEYPGRGDKVRENPLTDAIKIAQLLVAEIKDRMGGGYGLYGHSMGTLIGLLMLREIERLGYPRPKFAFFSGSEGPASRKFERPRHMLDDNDLIQELRALGGVSDEVLNEPKIMEFFLPIIRADFQAIETYHYTPQPPLDVPISVAIGTLEDVSMESARSWQKETRHPVELMQLRGHHFFIFDHVPRIMKLIAEKALS